MTRLTRFVGVVIFVTLPGPTKELEDETRLKLTFSAEQICGTESLFFPLPIELKLDDEPVRRCVRALSVLERTIFPLIDGRDLCTRMLAVGRGPEIRGFCHCRLATAFSSAFWLASTRSSIVGD